MKCTEKYWHGCHQVTLKRLMKDILRKDLGILVNGFWMILVLGIGEMGHSLACFGVTELVSYYTYNCMHLGILTYLP